MISRADQLCRSGRRQMTSSLLPSSAAEMSSGVVLSRCNRSASGRWRYCSSVGIACARPLRLELLVEDLRDEAIERHRVEADIGRQDDAGVDDLALGQL